MHSSTRGRIAALLVALAALLCAAGATAQDLDVNGSTVTLGGTRRFDTVRVRNGGRIVVPAFNGSDRANTGNLVIVARSITVDATSSIVATGAGYQPVQCGDGTGPTPTAGGRGGCSVLDSGGGGAHFGAGGRGTRDCNVFGSATMCEFPQEFEESCGGLNATSTACVSSPGACSNGDALPTVAGQPFRHSVYDVEFGAAGGDKGCRDGDGFAPNPVVGGPGGGRIVLVALTDDRMGVVTIDGAVTADGRRGCGNGNDSAGGGGGGSVLVVGDTVTVSNAGRLSAAGGLGGDTQGNPECPAGSQAGGTCDDCGGGGGGGIISIQSRRSVLAQSAVFNVSGAVGGTCAICQGEAGGSAGELQLDGAFVGELCDGYDNDFDGVIDEGFGTVSCGLGACARTIPECAAGAPPACSPMVTPDPTCTAPLVGAVRPRVAVILDTSASMLQDLTGAPTFGDGSPGHQGIDTNADGAPNDSRLHLARNALGEVISAYPEIDFALARYHQDQGFDRSCQTSTWIECQNLFASYDNPTDNVGPVSCALNYPARPGVPARTVTVRRDRPSPDPVREECINYAGTCGPPRRGADILSGFGTDTRDLVRWLDGRETNFIADETPGNYCRHAGGGDCEVRASGGTPIAGSLQAVEDYLVPLRATDPATGCRTYSIILVTDGAESCGGDPVGAARRLHDTFGVDVFVISVSDIGPERTTLDAISSAGSGGTRPRATVVTRPDQLVPALTSIISSSIRFERCNGVDDNCNGLIDEGFSGLGSACDDGRVGACRGAGAIRCRPDGTGTECAITSPGSPPAAEVCNAMDDNCNGRIDEGLTCGVACTPTGSEVCNGADDDCNGLVDESDPALGTACGAAMGVCTPGALRCVRGRLECVGAVEPRAESCNGIDEDCDGMIDDDAPCPPASACIDAACRRPCDPSQEFPCPFGLECLMRAPLPGSYCIPTACARCLDSERCENDRCVDRCEGVTCPEGATCVGGVCRDCRTQGCAAGQVCTGGRCAADPCLGVRCTDAEGCFDGVCRPVCDDRLCPVGARCDAAGRCASDACATVTCPSGQSCTAGACRADACARGCPTGTVCAPTRGCIDDPCATVRCPEGRACRLESAGFAACAVPGDAQRPVRDRVIASGYEPRCSVGPTPGRAPRPARAAWALPLAALGVALASRRRSR